MWGFTECRTVSHLLWNYSANRLPADERTLVERHLASCDACRAEADAYRQAVDGLASMRGDAIPQSRRGWRELQARLSEPRVQAAASRNRWGLPTLAWGSVVAVMGAFAVMYFSNQPVSNTPGGERGISGTAGSVADQNAGNAASESQDPFNPDDSYVDTSSDPAMVLHQGAGRRVRRSTVSASSMNGSQRGFRRAIRVADNRTSRRTYAGASHGSRVTAARLDSRHMDGAGTSANNEARDYVLAPVSAVADSDGGADYVMGSVMMNSRSVETEEARGL